MFHCGMEKCGSAAATYIVYSVYRFMGCIIDQSNWSGLIASWLRLISTPAIGVRGQLWLDVFIYRSICLLLLHLVAHCFTTCMVRTLWIQYPKSLVPDGFFSIAAS